MPSTLSLFGFLATSLLSTSVRAQTCSSFGVDFQNGGSYFQNISSTSDFTFVSIFEGCQKDVCNNILVDPNGNEYQCSDTPLLPSDTPEISTCPLEKSQMFSGDWSVVLISNNGNGDPIAYERDFYLTVGTPVTSTFTPTVTLTVPVTPIINSTQTITNVETATLNTTTTHASVTKSPTVTSHPHTVTVTKTKTQGTVSKTKYTAVPTLVTTTHVATCRVPHRQQHPDPTCTIHPTLVTAAALETKAAKMLRFMDRSVPLNREQRIQERKARLAEGGVLQKRSPDNATVIVTDTNTADYKTVTDLVTTNAVTMTVTTQVTTTTTTTTTSTVLSGKTTLAPVTVTASTPTTTKTKYTVLTTTVNTKTTHPTVTITKTYVNSAASAVCKARGGKMV